MFVGIDVEAGIAVTGGMDGVRPPEPVPGGPGDYLRRADERAESLVLAVPDHWFDVVGAAHREALYRELADGSGLPLRQFVPRSVAAAASVEGPAGGRLVCRLDAQVAGAVLCRASGQVVDLLGAEWREASRDPRTALVSVPAHPRAVLLLARARVQPRYRAAPLRMPGNVTAGTVLDAFAPVEEALKSAVSGVLARHGAAGDEELRVVIDGELGGHPLAPDAVRDATGTAVRVLEPHAAALGALLVARGSVRIPATAGHPVSLRAHCVRRGLLAEADIALTVPGEAVPMAVLDRGRAVTVDVPATHSPDVRIREGGRAYEVPCPGLRGGRYRLGMHATGHGPGVLVFRPDDGGEPVLLPLGGPAGPTTGATR